MLTEWSLLTLQKKYQTLFLHNNLFMYQLGWPMLFTYICLKVVSFANVDDGDEVLKIEVPTFLQRDQLDDYFNAVETDKRAKLEDINLYERCPYFFELHCILDKIFENETNLMSKERIKSILITRGASILSRASTFQSAKKM
jgi:hypothetical protein